MKLEKKNSEKNVVTKLEGGGKALVAGPLKKKEQMTEVIKGDFFGASLMRYLRLFSLFKAFEYLYISR